MSRGSSAVEQLIRNQQAVGSNPTSGSIFLTAFFCVLLIFPFSLRAEVGSSYQRIYNGAAFISLEPQLLIPNSVGLNLKGGFVFSRKLVMELSLGLGNVPFPSSGYYFGTRMYYRVTIDHDAIPGINFILGANNRNKVGIDLGLQLSKKLKNLDFYFAVLDKALVTEANTFISNFLMIPGVEVALSRQSFLTSEAGWSISSRISYISLDFLVALY